ncbi:MAG: hypothetical protein IBJ16_08890 [Chitinophagaceae bacterium]|nr:hypothetical protein [Chitinophagaceae bacterium]
MNKQQAQSIFDQAHQIDSINFDEFVGRLYPDRTDLENIELTHMNLPEFIYLSKRVFQQFISEFENRENTLVLPFTFTQAQIGTAQVDNQMQNYFSHINSSNITQAESSLIWLVAYQVEHGFYDKPSRKSSETVSGSLNKLSEKLNLIETNIYNKQKEIEKQFAELENSKKEIQSLISQKREELAQITTNLTTSNTNATQIAELLNKGTEQGSRLNTLLEQQEQNKSAADKKLQELQDLYNSTNDKLTENVKTVLSQIEEFKKQVTANEGHLSFVEGKRSFFEERIKYLEDLIGREVGVSLFETFKQRKIELSDPVRFWRVAVPVMSIAPVAWVFFLFKNQAAIIDINVWWQVFAINTLKTIPAIFLLLFSINQYRKERNFQEEYAFKSAVALTIDAYASRIKDDTNKDRLIMEAVLNVYKTPIEERHIEKKPNKATNEMMKTMLETTRDLVKSGK